MQPYATRRHVTSRRIVSARSLQIRDTRPGRVRAAKTDGTVRTASGCNASRYSRVVEGINRQGLDYVPENCPRRRRGVLHALRCRERESKQLSNTQNSSVVQFGRGGCNHSLASRRPCTRLLPYRTCQGEKRADHEHRSYTPFRGGWLKHQASQQSSKLPWGIVDGTRKARQTHSKNITSQNEERVVVSPRSERMVSSVFFRGRNGKSILPLKHLREIDLYLLYQWKLCLRIPNNPLRYLHAHPTHLSMVRMNA